MSASRDDAHCARRAEWKQASRAKNATGRPPKPAPGRFHAGFGPNKAAGRKGGIRRQGSKRG
ncbi:hypothetical protein B5F40_10240 [Gordonibacter sp. An230]|nr:hypothetical protein B5F40_10240 [Gordonibacter sp. An230]